MVQHDVEVAVHVAAGGDVQQLDNVRLTQLLENCNLGSDLGGRRRRLELLDRAALPGPGCACMHGPRGWVSA